jgi:catechol 2,3-dioxygenase-like lactoylglutathione lyase family enzyme
VKRLRAKGVAFGNDPEDSTNGQTTDPHGGGRGRVYFLDPDRHLFEVVA